MKRILIACLWALPLGVMAQNPITEILKQVEANNLMLQSIGYSVQAQKSTLASENNLSDPEVEYVHQWGNPAEAGKETELTVIQEFDFPTAYVQRNRYNQIQGKVLDRDVEEALQDIKLKAAQLCVQIIGLNRESALLQQLANNLEKHAQRMEQALHDGDAVVLEVNKVKMSLMEINAELRDNDGLHQEVLQQLIALNGGKPVQFTASAYPEIPSIVLDVNALTDDYREHDARLHRLTDEVAAGSQLIKVKQAEGLPKMHVGYQRNTALGEKMNGVVGGISIPLFSNRGKVKSARAEQTSRTLELQDQQLQLQSEVLALYNKKEQLAKVLKGFDQDLIQNQVSLLGKALDLGEMTIMDYLTEVNQVLDVQKEFARTEQEYQQICYELIRYRL